MKEMIETIAINARSSAIADFSNELWHVRYA
jgi:hypothetical protein